MQNDDKITRKMCYQDENSRNETHLQKHISNPKKPHINANKSFTMSTFFGTSLMTLKLNDFLTVRAPWLMICHLLLIKSRLQLLPHLVAG